MNAKTASFARFAGLTGKAKGRPALVLFPEVEAVVEAASALGVEPHVLAEDEALARRVRKRLSGRGGRVVRGTPETHWGRGFAVFLAGVPEGSGERAGRALAGFLKEVPPEARVPVLLLGKREDLLAALPLLPLERAFAFREGGVSGILGLAGAGAPGPLEAPEAPLEELERLLDDGECPDEKPFLAPKVGEEVLEGMLEAARRSPAWEEVERATLPSEGMRPLAPLKPAHLALLAVGGLLDLTEITVDGRRHLLLGVLDRALDEEVVEERREGDVTRLKVKRIQRFAAKLVLLDLERLELVEVA